MSAQGAADLITSFASGAGANGRRALGTVVVGGLFLATVLIIMVPIFYYVIERLREHVHRRPVSGGTRTEAQQPTK